MSWFWKTIRALFFLGFFFGGILALVVFAIGWWGSGKLVTVKRADLEQAHREVQTSPQLYGFDLDSFELATVDGLALKGCILTPNASAELGARGRRVRKEIELRGEVELPRRDEIRGTIIMSHGLGGRKEHNFAIAERFTAVGFRCVIYDSRAHGESEGEQCSYGFYERDDLRRVLETAKEKVGDLGPVGLFGVSLGSSIGLQTMDHSDEFKCGVFVSPFATLNESVWRVAKEKIGPWSFVVVPSTDIVLGLRYGFRMIEAASVASASRIDEPVMLVHGSEDQVTPFADSEVIFDALQSPTKILRKVEGGDHHAVLMQGGETLYAEMCEFFLAQMWG